MTLRIDRCLCFNKTFDELNKSAQRHQVSDLHELQRHVEFGKKCRLCHPYVRRMLSTGQTVFHEILTEPSS